MIQILPGGRSRESDPPKCACFCISIQCRFDWGYMEGYADAITDIVAEHSQLKQ